MLADLRRALEAREELQQRLVTVIESVQDGLIEIDAAGSVVMFNKAAEEMFGYGRDEVIGRDVKMLMRGPSSPPSATTTSPASARPAKRA